MLTSSQPHMFTYSHLHIFLPSNTHILTSSHLSSSHLLFLSLSLSRPLSRSLSFLFFSLLVSLKAAGSADEARRYVHLFARNEVRVSKTNDFYCNLTSSVATVSHQVRWECHKNWWFFASLVGPAATLSHEMMFGCQKLRFFFCEFGWFW